MLNSQRTQQDSSWPDTATKPIRRTTSGIILEQYRRAHVGHTRSALSVADIITALYSKVLKVPSPRDPERNRFILSKGRGSRRLRVAFVKGS